MAYKIFLRGVLLWLTLLPHVKSHLYEPSSPGITSHNIFRSRNSFTVRPQSSRQRSYSSNVKASAGEQVDDKEPKDMINSFLVRESRNSFIAKVYGIVAFQLILTAISITIFGTNPAIKHWILASDTCIYVPLISGLISFLTVLVMTFSTYARRSSPLKYNLLALFTFGEAVSVGFVTSFFKFRTVVSAMLATALATTAISVYTIKQNHPKYDLSQWGAALSSCGFIFITLLFVQLLQSIAAIPTFLPLNETLVAFLGTCMFSFYLAYHTKLIIAGNHSKYRMNEKDFVFGAMTLYSDIMALFLQLLQLIADEDDGASTRKRRR